MGVSITATLSCDLQVQKKSSLSEGGPGAAAGARWPSNTQKVVQLFVGQGKRCKQGAHIFKRVLPPTCSLR